MVNNAGSEPRLSQPSWGGVGIEPDELYIGGNIIDDVGHFTKNAIQTIAHRNPQVVNQLRSAFLDLTNKYPQKIIKTLRGQGLVMHL